MFAFLVTLKKLVQVCGEKNKPLSENENKTCNINISLFSLFRIRYNKTVLKTEEIRSSEPSKAVRFNNCEVHVCYWLLLSVANTPRACSTSLDSKKTRNELQRKTRPSPHTET